MPSSRDILLASLSSGLVAKGIDLSSAGPPSLAWITSDALEVLDELEAAGVLVIGGDVWQLDATGRVRPAYANWHYELSHSAVTQDDVHAAAAKAKLYVLDLRLPDEAPALFEIVCHPGVAG